jgi:hypothetical protein
LPRQRTGEEGFRAYGTSDGGIPDPLGKAFDGLLGELESHRLRLEALEGERARGEAPASPPPEIDEPNPDEHP